MRKNSTGVDWMTVGLVRLKVNAHDRRVAHRFLRCEMSYRHPNRLLLHRTASEVEALRNILVSVFTTIDFHLHKTKRLRLSGTRRAELADASRRQKHRSRRLQSTTA